MTMFSGKISKRGYGPRIIENKLPDGYVRINDKLYKVNEDGTKTEIEMKGPFTLEEFLKLINWLTIMGMRYLRTH